MKKYLFFAASALALASCSSDDFVGDNSGNLHGTTNGEIAFAGGTAKITRANDRVGAVAAELLGKKFIVAGFKGEKLNDGIVTKKVFDHYTVEWVANSAGTTADNTSDWKYVGLTPQDGLATVKGEQTIKYWDYSTGQYDYIAFSTGAAKLVTETEPTNGEVKVTKVDAENAKTAAYTIKGTAEDLSKCYIADLITAYNPKIDGKPEYQKEVTLSFRNLTTKVRVALYETIPGYSVKDVKFYSDNRTKCEITEETPATLFASGTTATDNFYGSGTATVFFPTVGTDNTSKTDYNKAHVAIAGENPKTFKTFGNLSYTKSGDDRLGTDNIYLATTSSKATYATGTGTNHYEIALPNETGTTLTLRVNYTLVANDGSGEEIKVYGANAIIPAKYAEWKSNYAYTYIFKISDKTNGLTGLGENTPEGLYPITFDAVVADSEEGNQSTITTVATPSITTYQKGHDITKDEYSADDKEIYVMVSDENGALKTDLDKAKLYTVEGENISEATVHDALTICVTKDEASKDNVKGRNGITLTKADLNTDITTIPGVDGNNIKVNQESKHDAVSFTPENKTNETKTYAFVYQTNEGEDKQFVSTYTPETDKTVEDNTYYTNIGCTETAGTSLTAGTTYYYMVNKNTNTYAVKVIKVVK